ncbi:lantibiotic dehydratase [Micromonospora sp. WMMD1102]|uniref:lantibiotic dehydratase n=1 Tax=Micromonospora sp. WMMD1102 TaxID=3016105 RepID=UPI0024150D4D|nr:lantibiotic dehydratase [Micromonospora sp. WMMD1102]MDG4787151.1 lantibiotic dehydratase [Micromonospora sp. WMMD1102]
MDGNEPVLYRHAGGGMLRAAALHPTAVDWPALPDPDSCQAWLGRVWALPGFADAVRHASVPFADLVDRVVHGQVEDPSKVRRAALSVLRYLLRAMGRPTPFGLFAGVAPIHVGDGARVVWGDDHRLMIRPDTLWLDDVIGRLERKTDLLPHLAVAWSDLAVDRGPRIEVPRPPGRVTVRNTAVVRLAAHLAASPVTVSVLAAKVAGAFPAAPATVIDQTLTTLIAHGVLITSLRAPMTVTDPLGYLLAALEPHRGLVDDITKALGEMARAVQTHNADAAGPAERVRLRQTVTEQGRQVSSGGRTVFAGDLHLDCQVTVPAGLVQEMAYAAGALVRLTRQPGPNPVWDDWSRRFCDRYGIGAVVPVLQAVHPDAGLGFPAGYPGSVYPTGQERVLRRDGELLRLAWEAVNDGRDEIVVTDEIIGDIVGGDGVDPLRIPPHLELAATVHAGSAQAVQGGDYTFTVRPAWSLGTLTSRFGPTVSQANLHGVYAATPAGVVGALSVQLSSPPLYPHSENVSRLPAWLPDVLSVGEHRADHDPAVITLNDLGIVAAVDGLHLVSISRRRLVEPQVLHALALEKQVPPIVRFLATLTRGFRAALTAFEWGPHGAGLPFLPRVRYRRAILSPARWQVTAQDVTVAGEGQGWNLAFNAWRRRWRCPDTVDLHDEDRPLRLDLTVDAHLTLLRERLHARGTAVLTQAPSRADSAWMGGRAHEIVMPFLAAAGPAPDLVTGSLPLVSNTSGVHIPGSPLASWLYVQVYSHPERLDDIIGVHLPALLADLGQDPVYWFARYRNPEETDHLRLRLRVTDGHQRAVAVNAVGRWGQHLCDQGVASGLAVDTYRPEVGRYGHGRALRAAEDVFAADSAAVVLGMRLLPPRVISPLALAAVGMVEIADAFHDDPARSAGWLVDRLAARVAASADRLVASQVAGWSAGGRLPDGGMLPDPLAAAWEGRRGAVARYRQALPGDADVDRVLSALLHMHHNRARLIDRGDEAVCLRLARQVGLARQASGGGGR